MSKRSLIGHHGRCFDLRFSPNDYDKILSASEDGSAKFWSISQNKCLQTLVHSKTSEVLRATFMKNNVCTAGSDGVIHIWNDYHSWDTAPPKRVNSLKHRSNESQIYVCESNFGVENSLLSAGDNEIYHWDTENAVSVGKWAYFPSSSEGQQPFGGGERNPDNEAYVFDAKWQPHEWNTVGMALSDGTIRLLDTRQAANSVLTITLQPPPLEATTEQPDNTALGHATSLSWSEDGQRCCVTFGSGQLALLDIRKEECLSLVQLHHTACYGATFLNLHNNNCDHHNTIMTWSADSSVGIWDINTATEDNCEEVTVHSLFHQSIPDCGILTSIINPQTGDIICGGESRIKSPFLGIPLHVLNIAQQ